VAPGACRLCHTKGFQLKPESHLLQDFYPEMHGDLAKLEAARVESGPGADVRVYVCAATGSGVDGLRGHLKDCIGFHPAAAGALSARTRHLDALRRSRAHVETAHRLLTQRHAGELVAQELRDAHRDLGEITGEVSSDDLLGRIFSSFCIGK
jgi:tRNA modification GTPase